MTHEIILSRYTAHYTGGVLLHLGTAESYGAEALHFTFGELWKDPDTIDVTFHNSTDPNDAGVTVLLGADGTAAVPPEATQNAAPFGTLTVRGVKTGMQVISADLPYRVLPHAAVPGAESDATESVWRQYAKQIIPAGGKAGQALIKAGAADYDLKWGTVGGGAGGGEDGGYYTPAIDSAGTLHWTASRDDMPAVPAAQIRGPQGEKGDVGPQGIKGDTGPAGAAAAADKTLGLMGAAIGQNVRVKTVDGAGKPTAWEAFAPPVDTVVEQGTSGIWRYRKWASGISECWGIYTASGSFSNGASQWRGLYTSMLSSGVAFPENLFAEKPALQILLDVGNFPGFIYHDSGTAVAHTGSVAIACPGAFTVVDPKLHFYAVGRWK